MKSFANVIMKLLTLVCLLSEVQCSAVYTFINETGSSTTFSPWIAARSGRINLNFKSFDSDGLIFYVGDNNDPSLAGNYMYLKLEWGVAVLVTQVHYFAQHNEENKVEERVSSGRNLDDGYRHSIDIERRGSRTVFKVDGDATTLQIADGIGNLRITSNLYVGGIPQRYLHPTCKETVERFPRFLGCIEDLSYGEGMAIRSPTIIEEEYLGQYMGCQDVCRFGNRCMNGGKCQNFFRSFKCDCLGTRSKGQFCEKATPTVALHQLGFIEWEPGTSSNNSDIALTFKTTAQQGFLFGVGSRNSYIVAEVVDNGVRVSVKLETGYREGININDRKANDGNWHYLKIIRRKQEVRVALDSRFEQSKSLTANDDNDSILDNAYVGGEWTMGKTFPGLSKLRFYGTFTEAYYNGVDLISNGQYKNGARRPVI